MRAKSKLGTITRPESFGSSVYCSERDNIFLLDKKITKTVNELEKDWMPVKEYDSDLFEKLAKLGIVDAETATGDTLTQQGYSGVHLIGDFKSLPIVKKPLLVNCFATSWCPLRCVYCHADDLMDPGTRLNESFDQIEKVGSLARGLDALVYVVTGGDPITRPERTMALLKELPNDSGVVVDTSGAGDPVKLKQILKSRKMHLRVSIDSMDPILNTKLRPINKKHFSELLEKDRNSLYYAEKAIEIGLKYGSGVSIQTVVTSYNDDFSHLIDLRDWLYSRGVRNWILHVVINAGKANTVYLANKRKFSNPKRADIFPSLKVSDVLQRVVQQTEKDYSDMDIRTTDGSKPNSVFLVGSVGSLFVQGIGDERARKHAIDINQTSSSGIWGVYSETGHVSRYTNHDTP